MVEPIAQHVHVQRPSCADMTRATTRSDVSPIVHDRGHSHTALSDTARSHVLQPGHVIAVVAIALPTSRGCGSRSSLGFALGLRLVLCYEATHHVVLEQAAARFVVAGFVDLELRLSDKRTSVMLCVG